MPKILRLTLAVGVIALGIVSGSVSAQSPNVYTSIAVGGITSGGPVVGGFFTTPINVSVANSGGSSVAVQGVETYIGFDPAVVDVVDFDNNPTNGVQVEIRSGFFSTIQTGINLVEYPCSDGSGPACVHVALSQTTGGVTNGSGAIASIRWVALAAGATVILPLPSSILSDPNGMPITINTLTAQVVTVVEPGTIVGTLTRQGRTAGGHAGTQVSALSTAGAVVAGPVATAPDGSFVLVVPLGSTYTVMAAYPGYLSAQKSNVYVVGATVDVGSTQLRGGDVNSENCVNIFDLVTVAAWFSAASPPAPAAVDINDDGVVNIFDLTITASNFSRCGPTAW